MVTSPIKVMKHVEFINRIRKSLYYGVGTVDTDMEVSLPFAEYASEMFSKPHRGHSLHRLSCVAAANVQATPCSLIMALIYLDRLSVTDPSYSCRITPQELFVVSLMISTKFYAGHDERFYLEDWASEGHMTEERLKEIELEFLSAMDWNIYISNELFFDKLNNVERSLAKRQGLRRGWLTYSELALMLPSLAWAKLLVNILSVLAMSYAASVITVAGAFFIASQVPGTIWHRGVTAPDSPSNSLKLTISATSVFNGDVSALLLDVEKELLKLKKQNCSEEITITIYLSHQPIPNLPFKRNFRKLRLISSQESAENWLNINSQCSACESHNWIPVRSIQMENRWKHARNGSGFWQIITEAMQRSLMQRRLEETYFLLHGNIFAGPYNT
ncbi:protein CNPPD1 isoform X2 [Drosophila subpulchrella]|uniref:protein CNPPD1 isoform X2 n=1 Tax=Drosophila subpulchrella TaxID=1486046 RepID=UPI0018A1A604|nr:protein CNPPD1 isoform X2 [Drosophila subpulchrella]